MTHSSLPTQNPHSQVVGPGKDASSPPALSALSSLVSCFLPLSLLFQFPPPFHAACWFLSASHEALDSQF